MINPTQLTLDSTVGNLPSYDFQVKAATLGEIVAEKFRQKPELPGVIITHNSQLLGMISQVKFFDQMRLPEQSRLYYKNPIRELLSFLRIPPLVLSENFKINAAAITALNRPKKYVYEPIIIVFSNGSLRLIDLQDLLLAQSEILLKTSKMIQCKPEEYQSEIPQLFTQDNDDDEATGLLLESKSLIKKIRKKLSGQ
ncbi:MAG: hypothetical protein QNJ68_14770 [Microcoleaceae cyanobacterium MO_207.B10]|nr:hypothetical protein [Microcoleaceae cyanobacterium MO_207.B10]